MEEFNQSLFLLINASAHPNSIALNAAMVAAEWLIYLIPISLLAGWLCGSEATRKLMLEAVVAGIVGLSISMLCGMLWEHPRPFAIGLGTNFLAHSPDSSFPSDHLTLQWSVAFSFLLQKRLRAIGLAYSLLGLPMAWARIYLGVHYPFDMAGAAIVAALSAGICYSYAAYYINPLFRYASLIYGYLFAPFIRRGWMLK
ncbi:Bacitracin transport permease protein BCRC [Collimonas arenae]|uniref:Bacitracin transport permease protein BCRC n=1 Tax=Collimonas arenae TaxID=279058 RepID=A0A0A1FE86_9BURK|nr:undecaprenyl-diphosphatase [Collimonas arenae]AIY42771.1 Bacitracin transport permease protein BCRC [Collimonas arenae]